MSKKVHMKEVKFFETYQRKKNLFLWVVLENFNSLSRIQKKSSMSKKKSHFQLEKKNINSVSRIEKKKTVPWVAFVLKKYILGVIVQKKGSILWVNFFEKNFLKKKKGSSLWVIKKVKFFEFFFFWRFFLNESKSWTLFEYDSKNWPFFSKRIWLKELNFSFWIMTQRIEPLFEHDSKELNLCFEYDSKKRISFWVWLKK